MRAFGLRPCLVASHVLGVCGPADPGVQIEFQGGSPDDQVFARAAAGLDPMDRLGQGDLQAALEAIRATDRFRGVRSEENRILLDPWPPVARIEWRGDAPAAIRKTLFRHLRKGSRVGTLGLEAMRAQAVERLEAAGYPRAAVGVSRCEGDTRILLEVRAGPPNLVTAVEVVGDTGPFSAQDLIRATRVVPGRTLWNREVEVDCLRRLRKTMIKARRLESRVDVDWDTGGLLRVTVDAGPRVVLRHEGWGLGWSTSLKEMVPLARAERYRPELLEEGDRRILRKLRSRGHLDPQVSHAREEVRPAPGEAGEVTVTYLLQPGPVFRLGRVLFEGNRSLTEAELARAAKEGAGFLNRKATPANLDAVEGRVKALYESRGFSDVRIHRHVKLVDGKADLILRIREGLPKLIRWVRLELPARGLGDPWALGECLALLIADRPIRVERKDAFRTYLSDRPGREGTRGRLTSSERDGARVFTLVLTEAIPFSKGDLFRVYTALRQDHLARNGVLHPVVRTRVLEEDGLTGILIEVPAQPLEKVHRVVVQGADRTRAEAVLREIPLKPEAPLDPAVLARAQAGLAGLGAFKQVEAASLGETRDYGPPSPWKPGDLLFRVSERSPWLFTHSLGYDTTQGYYLGTNVQRLNVGGMGRTLDFDVRAGDGTLKDRTLRELFPTGQYTRSLDSYSVAYSDPWFAPGRMGEVLPDRTAFRTEGAYIQEQRDVYWLQRRRVISSLRLPVSPCVSFEAGYRFEHVDVEANVPGLSGELLSNIAKYPGHCTLSGPYAQLLRDTRDNAIDATSGTYSVARFEAASPFFFTSEKSAFLKLDLRTLWTWPVGRNASAGVVSLGVRAAAARLTAGSGKAFPLSERFFGGGPGSMRGVQANLLGPLDLIPEFGPGGTLTGKSLQIALGGQGMVLANLEYRFPMLGPKVWGEVFVDSGQVYAQSFGSRRSEDDPPRLPLRTALGLGLIFKVGFPVKVEYAMDVNRILKRSQSRDDRDTELKNVLISLGFQF